ncbi:ankyrin repeat-containing domain protein [Fusarium avenaceum]|nr:ankyrin repeat-containing domain protein [Fusarium avenaceum]
MEFSSAFTFRVRDREQDQHTSVTPPVAPQTTGTNCPHFAGFMVVCFAEGHNNLGLHPVITNATPNFQDVSLGGGSFDVRKVDVSSFPTGLSTDIFINRKYVAVKHPRIQDDNSVSFGDISLELQILRHPPLQKNENIVDLLSVMYHDTGNEEGIRILPALVLEYAEHGSLKAFQEAGYARSMEERLGIALDTARGLEILHSSGIVHGDIKPSNLLVFKHPTRKYIVKLSDFGFAMPVEGGQLIGSTEVYSAPEADGASGPSRYLRQQDIYSFGLTLWTVFSDGIPYYSSLPDGERIENLRKIKKSNLLPSLAAFNVLYRLRNESYPLMTLVKVIVYSTQLQPEKRFSNMSKIIEHLEMTESIVRNRNGHDTPDCQALRTSSKLLLRLASEAKPTESEEEQSERLMLTGLVTLSSVFLSKELGIVGSEMTLDPEQFRSILVKFLPKAHERFYSFLDEEDMPLKKLLQDISKGRIEHAVAELLADSANSGENGGSGPISARTACQMILDCAGFLNEPSNHAPAASDTSPSIPTPLHLMRDEDFIPDISKSSIILRKAPKPVRVALAESLKGVFNTSSNENEKAHAALNLAYAYVDEIGHDYDLKMAAEYIFRAASMGLEKARTLYISTFSHVPGSEELDEETLRTWLFESAQAGSPTALRKLKDVSLGDWQQMTQTSRDKELNLLGVSPDVSGEMFSMFNSMSLGDTDTTQVQSVLIWSVVQDKPEATLSCLDRQPGLAAVALQNGETPVLIASRLGRRSVLEAILNHAGCDNAAELTDERGITALHWLCSFADEDIEATASLLASKGTDLNSPACAISSTQYGVKVHEESLLTYTPLHWAVVQNRVVAVDALIKLGADPNFCMEAAEGEEANLTPLELACGFCHSEIVARLLQEDSIRQVVDAPTPMINGKDVMYRPLFHVVRGGPRWQRLVLSGVNFEEESRKTIQTLIENGASTDAVLQVHDVKMPAVFATAYHQCSADFVVSGLQLGFADQINARFGGISSGGSALFLAITHGDRVMFKALLDAGADVTGVDNSGLNPLHRAAKETDDVYFIEALLDRGLPVDPADQETISAFWVAVWTGNLTIARYLYDQGADRERIPTTVKRNILGEMLFRHTRNALGRIKFLLSLPDRDGSDGFMVSIDENTRYSLLHFAIPYISEFAQDNEITGIMMAEILRRYNTPEHLDNTSGPHEMTALAMAAEVGNYFVARRLLEYGANPNIPDQYGRTALDLVHKRYCFPETFVAKGKVDTGDELAVSRVLRAVNENTSELLGLLYSYKAEVRSWRPPSWLEGDPGHRTLAWVMERLREDAGSSE